MASRYEVEVTLTSAKDLKNISWRFSPLRPYAVVWVDPQRKLTTRADEEGDTSPHWNQTLLIPLDRPIEDSTLHIDIVHAKSPDEDIKPLIGSAKLHLRSVVDEAGLGSKIPRTLKLTRPSGRPHGKLDLEVAVRDTRYTAPDPYNSAPYGVRGVDYAAPPPSGYPYASAPPAAYGAPPPSGYGYGAAPAAAYAYGAAQPPPPAGYAYGAAQPPPPAGYAYGAAPPQPAGYGYGAAPAAGGYDYGQAGQGSYVQEDKKKSKFGGMGTGLAVGAVAGALGGLVLAEGFDKLEDHVADEAADRVEDNLGDDGGDYYDGDDGDGGW